MSRAGDEHGGRSAAGSAESGIQGEVPEELDRVRSELRRLGYLNHGVERFLLQDALRDRPAFRTLLTLAAKVGWLGGAGLAVAMAFALAAANGNLTHSPFDLVTLTLHLFAPVALGIGVGFLALCAALVLLIEYYHVRRIEMWCLGAALLAGFAGLAFVVWRARDLPAESPGWQVVVLLLVTALVIFALVRVVHGGLLTLAIRLTDLPPRHRLFSRRAWSVVIVIAAFLLALPAVLKVRAEPPSPPTSLPRAPGDRVLLVGVDGVLADEFDYLLARGELPGLNSMLGRGRLYRYEREEQPVAAFWTSVATGLPSPEHGVVSLDSFRPLGVKTPLARTGVLRPFFQYVEVPLGLAEYRPLLANLRRAFSVWELASRGGEKSLVIDWWATYPAMELPGLMVSHGAYQLLLDGVERAVAPESARDEIAQMVLRQAEQPGPEWLAPALDEEQRSTLAERALYPDEVYRTLFLTRLRQAPRAAAIYLPAVDLAADGWSFGPLAFSDLQRYELRAADRLIAEAAKTMETIVVVVDPGRRIDRGAGRMFVWRANGCSGTDEGAGAKQDLGDSLPVVEARAAASALIRALGLPQSAELSPPPEGCSWPEPPAFVETFGRRQEDDTRAETSGEYLEKLRSLGYL